MKRFFHIALAGLVLAGCAKEMSTGEPWNSNEGSPYSAIVTVKQGADGVIFLQLDEDTRLTPVNYGRPYSGMERIICELANWGDGVCRIHWMDFLEKGSTVSGSPDADSEGLDVLNDWMTTVEDGFLTLHYSTWWGDGSVRHSLSVVTGSNPENPYELWLHHSRNGDAALEKGDALIYFDINSLPSTEGEYVTLTLKWQNGEGNISSRDFRFRTRLE